MIHKFFPGQFILVSLGRGKAVARVERVTPKRVYARRLVGRGTADARWSFRQTPYARETLELWAEPETYKVGRGNPSPPKLADFNRALALAADTLERRKKVLADTDKASSLYRWNERDVRAARNTIDQLRADKCRLAEYLRMAKPKAE